MEWVLQKYETTIPQEENLKKCCQLAATELSRKMRRELEDTWSQNMNYGRVVLKEGDKLTIPCLKSPSLDAWRRTVLMSGAEDQLHGPERRNCRRGCGVAETPYHVAAACTDTAYITGHDYAAHWIIKTILKALHAPRRCIRRLQFARAACNITFKSDQRSVTIKGGKKL